MGKARHGFGYDPKEEGKGMTIAEALGKGEIKTPYVPSPFEEIPDEPRKSRTEIFWEGAGRKSYRDYEAGEMTEEEVFKKREEAKECGWEDTFDRGYDEAKAESKQQSEVNAKGKGKKLADITPEEIEKISRDNPGYVPRIPKEKPEFLRETFEGTGKTRTEIFWEGRGRKAAQAWIEGKITEEEVLEKRKEAEEVGMEAVFDRAYNEVLHEDKTNKTKR